MRIQLGRRTIRTPYARITEVSAGPRTEWWQLGRRDLGDGVTGSPKGGSSVRIGTGERSVVVPAEEVVPGGRRESAPVQARRRKAGS